jgi:predicted GIY-YIG superfamily endonuclease
MADELEGLEVATYWSDMCDRRTTVYRFYDSAGTLLYVGLTMNLRGRLDKHHRRPWWPQVASMETVDYPDRESAKSAERYAIHHENPVHNITRPRLECC